MTKFVTLRWLLRVNNTIFCFILSLCLENSRSLNTREAFYDFVTPKLICLICLLWMEFYEELRK